MDLFELLVLINFGVFPKKTCYLPRVKGALTVYLMDSATYSIMRLESEISAIAWDLNIFLKFQIFIWDFWCGPYEKEFIPI